MIKNNKLRTLWARSSKGLPTPPPGEEWAKVQPTEGRKDYGGQTSFRWQLRKKR